MEVISSSTNSIVSTDDFSEQELLRSGDDLQPCAIKINTRNCSEVKDLVKITEFAKIHKDVISDIIVTTEELTKMAIKKREALISYSTIVNKNFRKSIAKLTDSKYRNWIMQFTGSIFSEC
jgi:hypothetical protein